MGAPRRKRGIVSSTRSHSSLTRAARARAKVRGQRFTEARSDVCEIRELMTTFDLTYDEAAAEYDDPCNELLCDTCGWAVGMACPECPGGCGCYTGRCSGWRHREFAHEDDPLSTDDDECEECGGNVGPYGCNC